MPNEAAADLAFPSGFASVFISLVFGFIFLEQYTIFPYSRIVKTEFEEPREPKKDCRHASCGNQTAGTLRSEHEK